jgi:hypothetical protein
VVTIIGLVVPDSADRDGGVWRGVDAATTGILLAFPYLLFRFAGSFRAPPAWLDRLALAGFLTIWAAAVLVPSTADDPRTLSMVLLIVAALTYWTGLSLWVVARLWRPSRTAKPRSPGAVCAEWPWERAC